MTKKSYSTMYVWKPGSPGCSESETRKSMEYRPVAWFYTIPNTILARL